MVQEQSAYDRKTRSRIRGVVLFRLIGIQNLKKAYGSFELSVESFSLYAGEVVGVVGRNGAGKSTFLDLILGERSGDAGSVSLFGGEYAPCEMGAKRRMGFVVDDSGFDERFTLREAGHVASCIYDNWDEGFFSELLEKFSLGQDAQLDSFSRGMAIKGQLSLALAHRPQLLILDEITSGLDPVSRLEILGILRAYILADSNRGAIYTTHITDDLKVFADRVMLLDAGEVLSIDPVAHYKNASIDYALLDKVCLRKGAFA